MCSSLSLKVLKTKISHTHSLILSHPALETILIAVIPKFPTCGLIRVDCQVLLGWREDGLAYEDGSPLAKVELNPKQKDQPKNFTAADDLIILRPDNSPFDLRASKSR